jgi:hypothetical protein
MMVLIPCVLNVTFEIGSYLRQYQLRRGVDAQKASVSNVPSYYSKLAAFDRLWGEFGVDSFIRSARQVAELIGFVAANPSYEVNSIL